MRFAMCENDIIDAKTAALNLKYFNEKKGSYWSSRETKCLRALLLKYKCTAFAQIQAHEEAGGVKPLDNFSETEIRLRICKVLKVYDLSPYQGKVFASLQEINAERTKNVEHA
jgi:hypothetical protein